MTGKDDQQAGPGGNDPPPDMGWLFFRFDGRVSREVYWLSLGFIWSAFLAVVTMLGSDLEAAASGGVFWTAFIVSQWAELALLVKRLHDRDLPGFWAIIKFLPFIGLVWMILAGVMEGDGGPNSYGPGPDRRGKPPPPNPSGGAD